MMEAPMKYMLMDYVVEAGWPQLTKEEQEHWLGAYKAYMQAMTKAGVLKSSNGLFPTSSATTVRVANGKPQVLDGPYADSKEQLGVVEVRPVREGTLLTNDISEYIKK
jgi:hypothetical protein